MWVRTCTHIQLHNPCPLYSRAGDHCRWCSSPALVSWYESITCKPVQCVMLRPQRPSLFLPVTLGSDRDPKIERPWVSESQHDGKLPAKKEPLRQAVQWVRSQLLLAKVTEILGLITVTGISLMQQTATSLPDVYLLNSWITAEPAFQWLDG